MKGMKGSATCGGAVAGVMGSQQEGSMGVLGCLALLGDGGECSPCGHGADGCAPVSRGGLKGLDEVASRSHGEEVQELSGRGPTLADSRAQVSLSFSLSLAFYSLPLHLFLILLVSPFRVGLKKVEMLLPFFIFYRKTMEKEMVFELVCGLG